VCVSVSGCGGRQTWHTTKLALISCALYVPVSVVMITMAWSSKKHRERHLHSSIPVFISGVAFLCATVPPQPPGLRGLRTVLCALGEGLEAAACEWTHLVVLMGGFCHWASTSSRMGEKSSRQD